MLCTLINMCCAKIIQTRCSVHMIDDGVFYLTNLCGVQDKCIFFLFCASVRHTAGRIQDFKLGGAHLKKLRRAEGGAKTFGVFRVKNHDFTPKNHIFSNCGGRREHFWGISCEKSRFYAKKSYFFSLQF